VYAQANGALGTPVVDFGIVRVGDVVGARNITVGNTAAVAGLNDTLRADLSGISGPFSSGNSVSGVAAQGSGQIGVALNTGTAGVYSQNGVVGFLSQNPDMVDVSAGANGSVLVKAQVNNLANADFDLLVGLGLLTQNGTDYILDLGNLALSGTEYTLVVRLDNEVSGPADDLRGLFDLSAVDEFNLTGFGAAVGPLGAGQATGNLGVGFLAAVLGLHEDIVNFNGFSTNASDPNGIAQQRRLIIRANVIDPNGNAIPEPGTLALLLMAAVGAAVARRQRRRAH
jgi:PEP-CTERM motif